MKFDNRERFDQGQLTQFSSIYILHSIIGFWLSLACGGAGVAAPFSGETLQIHIFRGKDQIFGFTADPEGFNLPSSHGPWRIFRIVSLSRGGRPFPGVQIESCLNDIEKHGVHVTDTQIRITDIVINSANEA